MTDLLELARLSPLDPYVYPTLSLSMASPTLERPTHVESARLQHEDGEKGATALDERASLAARTASSLLCLLIRPDCLLLAAT